MIKFNAFYIYDYNKIKLLYTLFEHHKRCSFKNFQLKQPSSILCFEKVFIGLIHNILVGFYVTQSNIWMKV